MKDNNSIFALEVHQLHRFLGVGSYKRHILKGVSFKVQKGKVYAIIGPSGCGKSTLLYLLGLLDTPDMGSITIAGNSLDNANDSFRTFLRNEYIGFVFQFHFLLTEFTVLENVCLPMRKHNKIPKTDQLLRGKALIESVGLLSKQHTLASHLSGGERQRIAIARALANKPALILADEPTGNLDTGNGDKIFDLLMTTCRKENSAVIMVTHNEELALRCDYKMSIRDGIFL